MCIFAKYIFANMKTGSKILFWVILVLLLSLGIFCYMRFWFKWGDGVKAGNLNQLVYKGWIWKTYEGRIIMSGFKNDKTPNGSGLHSNEFNFSVDKKAIGYRPNGSVYSIADSLMRCSGKNVQVRYREYRGALPWRGIQRYIVYDILSVTEPIPSTAIPVETE